MRFCGDCSTESLSDLKQLATIYSCNNCGGDLCNDGSAAEAESRKGNTASSHFGANAVLCIWSIVFLFTRDVSRGFPLFGF